MTSEDFYLKEISKKQKFNPQEQLKLIKEWKYDNNKDSFNLLYNSIIRSIPRIAKALRPKSSPHYMDLIQEGNIVAYQALKSYDVDNYSSSVFFYATKLAKKAMINFLLANEKPITIKNSTYVSKAISLAQKDSNSEDMHTFIEKNKLQAVKFQDIFERVKANKKFNKTEDNILSHNSGAEESLIRKDVFVKVKSQIVKIKNESHKNMVIDYFFNDKTLTLIGKEHGLAKQRIQQIIKKEVKKLQSYVD